MNTDNKLTAANYWHQRAWAYGLPENSSPYTLAKITREHYKAVYGKPPAVRTRPESGTTFFVYDKDTLDELAVGVVAEYKQGYVD